MARREEKHAWRDRNEISIEGLASHGGCGWEMAVEIAGPDLILGSDEPEVQMTADERAIFDMFCNPELGHVTIMRAMRERGFETNRKHVQAALQVARALGLRQKVPILEDSSLVTMHEAARMLGVSFETIRIRARRGQLAKVHIGRAVRLRRSEIEALVHE